MDIKTSCLNASPVLNEQGQSLLEVIFVLPVLFLFVGLLYKVNMAIQMAINNTQYSRSQLFVLTANSAEYPRYQIRFTWNLFGQDNQDRMLLGVADAEALQSANANENAIEPLPQSVKLGRKESTVKGSDERGEVKLRNEIRVRNTAAICTQLNSVASKRPWSSTSVRELKSRRWPFGMPVCQYNGRGNG